MGRRGHGEGSIYRRKDGRWAASITLENHRRKTYYGKTRKEVQEKLNAALHEQRQGTLATGKQQTMSHYLKYWLEEVHKPTIRLSSYDKYRKLLDRHILPELGHLQVQKLSAQQVQAFYTRKLEEGLSPSTIHVMHAILHKALGNAVRWGLVSRNVCDIVSPPRQEHHEIRPLTIEQAQQLLEQARGHRLEVLLTLAITTGMRRGEIIGLRWSDINFEDQSLYIRRTVDRITRYGYVESEPKTARSRRRITLPSLVVNALQEQRTRQAKARLKAGKAWHENDLVFSNTHGGFLHPTHMYIAFQQLLKDAGLPPLRFHDLRHSAATILMAMGTNVKIVQELLGHSTAAFTLNVYGHVFPSLQKEAMEKWDILLRPQEEQDDQDDSEDSESGQNE
jgi:integrase